MHHHCGFGKWDIWAFQKAKNADKAAMLHCVNIGIWP